MKNSNIKKTKAVFIPKLHKNDDALYVAVNGKSLLVRKGETVELPLSFAEVVENSRKAATEAERFIDAQSHND